MGKKKREKGPARIERTSFSVTERDFTHNRDDIVDEQNTWIVTVQCDHNNRKINIPELTRITNILPNYIRGCTSTCEPHSKMSEEKLLTLQG